MPSLRRQGALRAFVSRLPALAEVLGTMILTRFHWTALTLTRPYELQQNNVTDSLAWPKQRYAWYVVAMLVLAYSFGVLDRAVIGLLVQPIKADLGITDSQIGLLQGLAFALCYTTFGLAFGLVADRTSRRWLMAGAVMVWSASTIACGFANSFGTLFLARIGVGFGEACIMPVAGSLIADYFQPLQRPKAYGIFLLGGTFGTTAGYLLGSLAIVVAGDMRSLAPGLLGGAHDWQITFFLAGAPGLVVALLFLLTVREPVRHEKAGDAAKLSIGPVLAHVRANQRAYFALLAGTVLNVTCIYAQIAWLATLVIRIHGWTAAQIGTALALVSPVGASSSLTVGWTISWLAKRGRSDAPVIACMMHSTALLIFGPITVLAPSPLFGLVPYICFNLFANWSTAAALTGLSQVAPNELRGQVTALYTLLTGLVSLTVGGFAVGFLNDRVFTGNGGIAPSMAAVFAVCGLLGVMVLSTGRPAFRAAVARARAWAEPN